MHVDVCRHVVSMYAGCDPMRRGCGGGEAACLDRGEGCKEGVLVCGAGPRRACDVWHVKASLGRCMGMFQVCNARVHPEIGCGCHCGRHSRAVWGHPGRGAKEACVHAVQGSGVPNMYGMARSRYVDALRCVLPCLGHVYK